MKELDKDLILIDVIKDHKRDMFDQRHFSLSEITKGMIFVTAPFVTFIATAENDTVKAFFVMGLLGYLAFAGIRHKSARKKFQKEIKRDTKKLRVIYRRVLSS